jgi:hypothetical protein
MTPFELELSAGDSEVGGRSSATDLRGRKTVAAVRGLLVDGPQVLGDETDRGILLLKPTKLRVMNISSCCPLQYGLGEKSFPPQSNQPAGVKILRMQTPDAH